MEKVCPSQNRSIVLFLSAFLEIPRLTSGYSWPIPARICKLQRKMRLSSFLSLSLDILPFFSPRIFSLSFRSSVHDPTLREADASLSLSLFLSLSPLSVSSLASSLPQSGFIESPREALSMRVFLLFLVFALFLFAL